MLLRRISSHLVVCLFAISLSAGQNINTASGQDSSTTNNNKPSAGIRRATAETRKKARSDRLIAQQVRQVVLQDKSLSISASNIKIICQNGTVTLQGLVRSENEKQSVEAKAADVVGRNHVMSDLAVRAKN